MKIDYEVSSKLNLLVVEDDKLTNKSLASILKRHFNNVFQAYNGKEGLGMINEKEIDIVLTDITMPEMTGIEMLEIIRETDNDLPVILITAHNDAEYLVSAINLNASGFIPKPVDADSIFSRVNQALHGEIIRNLREKNQAYELELMKMREKYNDEQMSCAYEKELNLLRNELDNKFIETSNNGVEFYGFNTFYQPREILSGDCYSVRRINDCCCFGFLLDTMGKGVSASVSTMLSVAFINHIFDILIETSQFDFEVLINKYLRYMKKVIVDAEMISGTFFYCDYEEGYIKYASFGMPSILVYTSEEGLDKLKSNNPPITKFINDFNIDDIKLSDAVKMLIYTDGLNETQIGEDKLYMQELDNDFIKSNSYSAFMNNVNGKIIDFDDDITLISTYKYSLKPIWEEEMSVFSKKSEIDRTTKEFEKKLTDYEIDPSLVMKATTAYHELVFNAYEHGNLGITYELKSDIIASEKYDEELIKLENECNKQIHVKYGIYNSNGQKYIYGQITDEGEGFTLSVAERSLKNVEAFNGRGIIMTKTFSDGIYYNEKGNSVRFLIGIPD